ncbi:unnamed protein product [Toxocara canis]|uniref:Signal recognition particle protein n=1 Tax=Toxocara canis TaxID=6265 RepID=A0A183UW51_TOXCA|nr:unnamed protein product [Toxocara canis]
MPMAGGKAIPLGGDKLMPMGGGPAPMLKGGMPMGYKALRGSRTSADELEFLIMRNVIHLKGSPRKHSTAFK